MMPDSVTDQIDIPTQIRKIRQQLGLTQEEFAAKLGVTFPTVSRWENGHRKPSKMALLLLKNLTQQSKNQGEEVDLISLPKSKTSTKD